MLISVCVRFGRIVTAVAAAMTVALCIEFAFSVKMVKKISSCYGKNGIPCASNSSSISNGFALIFG